MRKSCLRATEQILNQNLIILSSFCTVSVRRNSYLDCIRIKGSVSGNLLLILYAFTGGMLLTDSDLPATAR